LGFLGIAIATSAAAWVNAVILFWLLRRRGHLAIDQRLRTRAPRLLFSSLAMGALLWGTALLLAPLMDLGFVTRLLAVVVLVLAGMLFYVAACWLSGAARPAELFDRLRRRPAA
jgi:putative peptidoglycan lipid II flippase